MGLFDFFKRKPATESVKEEEIEKCSVFFSPIKGKVSMLNHFRRRKSFLNQYH